MCRTVSNEGACSPYCRSISNACAVVSLQIEPCMSNFMPLISIIASCKERARFERFSSMSVCRWVTIRWASNSPFCQNRMFLLLKSNVNVDCSFFKFAFNLRFASHRLANTFVSRSSKVTVVWRSETCLMSISLIIGEVAVVVSGVFVVSAINIFQLAIPSFPLKAYMFVLSNDNRLILIFFCCK